MDPSGRAAIGLTRTGRGVLVAGVLLTAAGWGTGYPAPVVPGTGCLLAVATAVSWTLRGPGVRAERRLTPGRSVRGGEVTATVTVTPQGRPRRALRLADGCGDRTVDVPLPPVGAEPVRATYAVPTPDRGRLPVGPLRVVVTDPLGLCERSHSFGGTGSLLVRPRAVPLTVPASGHTPHLDGATVGASDGATSAFHALRTYLPGDDPRLIHWASSARTGTLMVRQMADLSRPHTTVLLDTDPDAYEPPTGGEEFETAVEVCASLVQAASGLGFPVRLFAGGTAVGQPASRTGDALLDALAVVGPGAVGGLERALGALRRAQTGGSLVVVTGPGTGARLLRRVAALHRMFQRVAVVRVVPDGGAAGEGIVLGAAAGLSRPLLLEVARVEELPGVWRQLWAA